MLPRAIEYEHRRLGCLPPRDLPVVMTYAKVMQLGWEHIVAAQKQQSAIIAVLTKQFWQRAVATYLVPVRDTYKLCSLCSSAAKGMYSAAKHMEQWLSVHEPQVPIQSCMMGELHREYHACRLLRCYLEATLLSSKDNVIAGSWPAALLWRKEHPTWWQPNDVDVFVVERKEFDHALRNFGTIVAEGLQLQATTTYWRHYPAPASNDDENVECFELQDQYKEVQQNKTIVQEYIRTWKPRNGDAEYGERVEDMKRLVQDSSKHLPDYFQKQAYKIVETAQCRLSVPAGMEGRLMMPYNTMKLNVILVEFQEYPITSIDCMARAICENFDLSVCCVSVQLTADQHMVPVPYGTALQDIKKKIMRLKTTSFTHRESQMRRILKYATRGCTWEG